MRSLFVRIILGVVALVLTAGCAHRDGPPGDQPADADSVAQVVMTGALTGFALWPSGSSWIVLATEDGWRTVQNRTPLGVPTDGGLVLSARGDAVVVGVLPHELLTSSPVLTSADGGLKWTPTQVPGALLASSGSLARSGSSTWAALADGRVMTLSDGATTWHQATSARQLDPTGQFHVLSLESPSGPTGLISGSGEASRPVLYASDDLGHTWAGVDLPFATGSGTAVAYPPCHVRTGWLIPVLTGGALQVFTAHDLQGSWIAGRSLSMESAPVVACGPNQIWVAASRGDHDELFLQNPQGSWNDRGPLPDHIVSLAISAAGQGYAATSNPATLLSLQMGQPVIATPVALPEWVATIGGGTAHD